MNEADIARQRVANIEASRKPDDLSDVPLPEDALRAAQEHWVRVACSRLSTEQHGRLAAYLSSMLLYGGHYPSVEDGSDNAAGIMFGDLRVDTFTAGPNIRHVERMAYYLPGGHEHGLLVREREGSNGLGSLPPGQWKCDRPEFEDARWDTLQEAKAAIVDNELSRKALYGGAVTTSPPASGIAPNTVTSSEITNHRIADGSVIVDATIAGYAPREIPGVLAERNQRISDLEMEVGGYKAACEQKDTEIATLKGNVSGLEERVHELEDGVQLLEDANRAKEARIKELLHAYINLEKPPLFGNAKEYEFNYRAQNEHEAKWIVDKWRKPLAQAGYAWLFVRFPTGLYSAGHHTITVKLTDADRHPEGEGDE